MYMEARFEIDGDRILFEGISDEAATGIEEAIAAIEEPLKAIDDDTARRMLSSKVVKDALMMYEEPEDTAHYVALIVLHTKLTQVAA